MNVGVEKALYLLNKVMRYLCASCGYEELYVLVQC